MVDAVGYVNAVAGAPSYNGRMLRQLNAVGFAGATAARPLGARSGVRPGTSATTVTATSTVWSCKPFAGLLDGQVAGEAGPYPFAFDAVATGPVAAADGSNPRIDIIYVDVDDPSEDASSVPAVTRKYLAGGAAGSPVAPSAPAGCMTVAHINVPKSGGGSPTVTWVAPYCAGAGGVQDFNTKAQMDAWLTADVGQRAKVLATGAEYAWNGTAWASPSPLTRLQLDTTNSVVQTITQVGIGKMPSVANIGTSKAVTFPVPFASIPVVIPSFIGTRVSGAFNPAGLTTISGTEGASVADVTATGFTAWVYRANGGNLSAGRDYYYSWVAIGVPA